MRKVLPLVLVCGVVLAAPAWAANDPYFGDQWGLSKVKAEQAWRTGTGGGTKVAIVDSGVDLAHEDLSSKLLPGYDFIDDDSTPRDEHSHGTHVAGIASAITNNGKGVAGVAPDACILPVRVLGKDGSGTGDQVEAGIRWAARNGATVINLSLGEISAVRNVNESLMKDAIEYAWGRGVVVVVAAGNDILFPSGYRDIHAIVVGATDRDDQKAAYSNLSEAAWSMVAPGSSILSTVPGNGYRSYSGTSMATPHVAGAAAVLRGLGKSPQETVDILLKTADDLGLKDTDPVYGHGRLNLASAVEGLIPKQVSAPCKSSSAGGTVGTKLSPPTGGESSPQTAGSASGTGPKAQSSVASPAGAQPTSRSSKASGQEPQAGSASQDGEDQESKGNKALNLILGGALGLGLAIALLWAKLKSRNAPVE